MTWGHFHYSDGDICQPAAVLKGDVSNCVICNHFQLTKVRFSLPSRGKMNWSSFSSALCFFFLSCCFLLPQFFCAESIKLLPRTSHNCPANAGMVNLRNNVSTEACVSYEFPGHWLRKSKFGFNCWTSGFQWHHTDCKSHMQRIRNLIKPVFNYTAFPLTAIC